jgi:hypothetical protein
MTTPTASRPVHARKSLDVWMAPSLAGFALLGLTGLFGFEEANVWLLMLAAALTLAAPAAVFVHLSLTGELTRDEKRMWIREFTSSASASALADYLTATDRRATTARRAHARARRQRR